MKSSTVFLMTMAFAAGAWWTWSSSVLAGPAETCGEGPVPVRWPVGDTGFETPRLLSAHGQYQRIKSTDTPTVHKGVDVAACVGDVVYAVEDGIVEDLTIDSGGIYTEIRIADTDDPTQGWFIQHLDAVYVEEGDSVQRDQAIGTVVEFTDGAGFDHVHLERIERDSGSTSLKAQVNAGDPLSLLAAKADGVPPKSLEFGAPIPPDARFLFYEDDGSTESPDDLSLDKLVGTTVDIVANMRELFPGVGTTTCPTTTCETVEVSDALMPRRVSFSLLKSEETDSGTMELVRKLHNVIDLSPPIVGYEGATSLSSHIYRSESLGTYDAREFLVVLTNCQEDGEGSHTFDAGEYTLQLVLEDASGNVSFLERTLDLH